MGNVLQKYRVRSKVKEMRLPYLNWKDFRITVITNDNLPILIDFGDGLVQSVASLSTTTYSKASASDGIFIVYTANRLRQIGIDRNAPYRVNWFFSLSAFRVANNLLVFDFRSGNIFGDVGNLAPTLQTYQILSPEFGVKTNLSPFPSSLKTINQTGINSQYEFEIGQIASEMPILEALTITGKSRIYDELQNLPSTLRVIEISNTNFAIDINRRHRIGYDLSPLIFNSGFLRFVIDAENGYGFNTSQLDTILIYLANLSWDASNIKLIRLTFGHGVRSSASDIAVATLTALPNMVILLN